MSFLSSLLLLLHFFLFSAIRRIITSFTHTHSWHATSFIIFKTSPCHQNQFYNFISYSCTAFILFYFSIRTKLLLLFPIILLLIFANVSILTNYSSTVLLSNFPTFTNYSSTVFLLHLLNTLCTKLPFNCSYFSEFP